MTSTICFHWTPGNCTGKNSTVDQQQENSLALETIRQRVRKIRGSWSPEERRLRKIHGKLRRENLEKLLFGN